AIKDISVGEFVDKFKFGKPTNMYGGKVDWSEFLRKDKLRDKIVESFSSWRTAAKDSLTVHEYIKQYLYNWDNKIKKINNLTKKL
ncbi:MAG: hypothetical protein V1692_02765, partial [bacterium]